MVLSRQLKNAVLKCGMSRYRIAKVLDGYVTESELCRWLKGQLNLGSHKLDAIGYIIGAELVVAKKKPIDSD